MPAKNEKYTYGNGSRKAATATARLYKGKGNITINDKEALDYLSGNKTYLAEITDPLALTQKQKEYDITIRVSGGGLAGQVDAIKLAISKALQTEFPDLRPILKKAGFVTNKSSPTSWILEPSSLVKRAQPSQSDSAKPSSMVMIAG